MRLIDTDTIKLPKGFFENVTNVPLFYKWLDTLPTIDAIPIVHGQWLRMKIGWQCSNCTLCTNYRGVLDFNYCPSCGAKMNEKERDIVARWDEEMKHKGSEEYTVRWLGRERKDDVVSNT